MTLHIPVDKVRTVAVCFSGEPRMYNLCAPSIKNFFNWHGVDIKYFAHTWTENSYKIGWDHNEAGHSRIETETYSKDFILNDIQKFYKFTALEVEEKFSTSYVWDHLFYSEAKSNLLKKQYEQKNNMQFDIVVKARFDVAFDPDYDFRTIVSRTTHRGIHQRVIYSNHNIYCFEFFQPGLDDCFYFGSSYSMDLLQSNMFHVNRHYLDKLDQFKEIKLSDNPSRLAIGPGVRQYQLCNQLNLTVNYIDRKFFIYRKDIIPEDPLANYHYCFRKLKDVY